MHRQNPAKRAIGTWKEHFMSVAATWDPQFPVYEWCKLLEGVDLQLNLLRGSRLHPQISAECHLNGEFNYHTTPLAPLGTKTTVFVPTHNRKTWEFHCLEGFYLGPARHHYRCHRNYIPETKGERISDTVWFYPRYCKMPYPSSIDKALGAAKDLITALRNPLPSSPFQIKDEQQQQLKILAQIFKDGVTNKQQASTPRVRKETLDSPVSAPREETVSPPTPHPLLPSNEPILCPPTHRYPTRHSLKEAVLQASVKHRLTTLRTYRLLEHLWPSHVHTAVHFLGAVMNEATGKMMEYSQLIKDLAL